MERFDFLLVLNSGLIVANLSDLELHASPSRRWPRPPNASVGAIALAEDSEVGDVETAAELD